MTLGFNELFLHQGDQVFPKSDVTIGGKLLKKGFGFPDTSTVFGVSYSKLLRHDFEVKDQPEIGYEITAYYVR